jgi:hypothetical protein
VWALDKIRTQQLNSDGNKCTVCVYSCGVDVLYGSLPNKSAVL